MFTTTHYRIKALAQRLPKSALYIKAGVYEELDEATVNYQKKIGNLVEIEVEKEASSFTLKLDIEESVEEIPKPKKVYKTRRNINDNSN